MEGSERSLSYGTIPALIWRDWGISQKPAVRVVI